MHSRCALVVIEEATESRTSPNPTVHGRRRSGNQDVTKPLVIALAVVMRDVLCECATEMTFADRDDPIEALGLDGSYEAFGVRVRVGRTGGRLHDGNARIAEAFADPAAPVLFQFSAEPRGQAARS